jgi:ABC-type phosphate transport system auxiliary subunit
MSFWTAAVIIVMIWGIVTIYTRRHDRELGVVRDEDGNPVFGPAKTDYDAGREIAELRERIKVLERIATENNTLDARQTRQIAAEIEALRDRQDG